MPFKDPLIRVEYQRGWIQKNLDKKREYNRRCYQKHRVVYSRSNIICRQNARRKADEILGPCAYKDRYCEGSLEFDHINGYDRGYDMNGNRNECTTDIITKVRSGAIEYQNLCHMHNNVKGKHPESEFYNICRSIVKTLMHKYISSDWELEL